MSGSGFIFFRSSPSTRLWLAQGCREPRRRPVVSKAFWPHRIQSTLVRVEGYERSLPSTRPSASVGANGSHNRAIPGFTLIELLIATFIASILGALLFSALYQVNRFVPVVDNTTAIYEKAALINAQLERDISGATAPNEFYYRQPEPEKKSAAAKAGEEKKKSEEEKKKVEQEKNKAEASEEKSEKKPKKPLEKIFYSTNKEGMLNQLSFITTNPLQVYWDAKSGSAKPRIARVLYMLKEESGTPKSYSLVRKESPNLEFEPIIRTGKEGPQEFVIAEGIKSLAVEYTYFVPEVKEKKQQPEADKGEKKEAQTVSAAKKKEIRKTIEWIPAETQAEGVAGESAKDQLPLGPQLVELKIALWDAQKKRSTSFTFKIRVPADMPEKRDEGDIAQKLLGTLREFFTQNFTPPANATRVTQRNQISMPRGSLRR